jgi:hypothetical protein
VWRTGESFLHRRQPLEHLKLAHGPRGVPKSDEAGWVTKHWLPLKRMLARLQDGFEDGPEGLRKRIRSHNDDRNQDGGDPHALVLIKGPPFFEPG